MRAAGSRLCSSMTVFGDVSTAALAVSWTNSWVSVATGEGLSWDYAGTKCGLTSAVRAEIIRHDYAGLFWTMPGLGGGN